ncbi:hypothetical protein CR155_11030 [Pollutimonas nitritireducens]|uniref:Uncharacterized protein n=1 Tax=Pollutimonas nitritireducens TaxID=2045209 RepID=A0A2N4UG41_9BURK|nr:hypothetical protein [Pollutimonas nitritireducens]PLC53955.1 hypothetical protein CR155_11030 [Pollutimonas nitritireducens]
METMSLNIPRYPMLRFVARHGRNLMLAVAVMLAVVGLAIGWQAASVIFASAAVILSVVVFVIGRALVEMVELIADMLLPK